MSVNYEDKSKIVNLAYRDVFIKRDRDDKVGTKIPANGSYRMKNSDIVELVQDGYKFLVGMDGDGSHATLWIDNKELREEFYFENAEDEVKQKVLDKEKIKEILAIKDLKKFKTALEDSVVTSYEKFGIMKAASLAKFNDGSKIRLMQEHTGYDFYDLDKVVVK